MKKYAFLFPGQGAQYVGMGKEFVQQFSMAKETLQEADELLSKNLSQLILNGPEDLLTETRNSQVAIYVTSVAILRVLQAHFPKIRPHYCAGLSLGEYTALHASQHISFVDGLKLVQARGDCMNEACHKVKGTMAVVLGLDADVVEQCVKDVGMPNDLWAANFNCPGQVVISGTLKGIEAGTKAVLARGAKRVLPLQVHGAFHSGLMKQAEECLAPYVLEVKLQDSSIGLVMNVPGKEVKGQTEIKHNLIQQVTHPVRWEQGIRFMNSQAIDTYIEIGCGKALAGFNKRIDSQVKTLSIETLADLTLLEGQIA